MSVLEILKYPEPRLLEKSEPVSEINGVLQARIDRMFDTLYLSQGLGLAAPQVGFLQSFFIYDLSQYEDDANVSGGGSSRRGDGSSTKQGSGRRVVLNPEIIEMEGEEIAEEGCLSMPGYFEKVSRAYRVQIKGFDREGNSLRIEGEGLAARLFQHEIDHLDGILMLNHLSSLKRDIFLRKFKKQQKYAGTR